jgi:HAD superfamily hydrolase (TIGR01509 family)
VSIAAPSRDRASEGLPSLRLRRPHFADDTQAASAKPADVHAVVLGWLSALAAAERAARSSTHIGAAETGKRLHRLQLERAEVALLLEPLAHERPSAALLVRCLNSPVIDIRLLGLPSGTSACVFDLEGVLTTSADVHRAAWSTTLDAFLLARAERRGAKFVPFDPKLDYVNHLGGRPRLAGVRAFLASRGISLPEGEPSDPPDAATVHALARRKQELLLRQLVEKGVDAFAGSVAYLEIARLVGARRAVVSASANTILILQRAGIAGLIEQQVDGLACKTESLDPRPAPDMLLAATARLGVDPAQTAAFETTPAGIAAARAGGFRAAVADARHENATAFAASDADLVVNDLGELLQRSFGR